MELTSIVQWLNSVFGAFDHIVLSALHQFAMQTNGTLTPMFSLISLLAEKGIGMLLLGIVLMCFQKTRKAGVCLFGAVCCGMIITDLVLKEVVARPRPFVDASGVYYEWWKFVGSPKGSGYSFPSGHVTAAMAAMTALFLHFSKKYSWTAFLFVILMGLSRNYLMVHYPSDILGGIIAGAIGAVLAFYITKLIFSFMNKHSMNRFCTFVLQFDAADFFLSKKKNAVIPSVPENFDTQK